MAKKKACELRLSWADPTHCSIGLGLYSYCMQDLFYLVKKKMKKKIYFIWML